MDFIMSAFGLPLGWIMWLMYKIIPNYAVALILFTIVTKLLLVPLSIKQQKGTIKMQIIQPKMAEIQSKYKSNPQKMNEEIQALYAKENYNPMAGCLPLLIQFPILFGLIDVIYKPLTHIMRVPADVITAITNICTEHGIQMVGYAPQITALKTIQQNPGWFESLGTEMVEHISSLSMTSFGLDLSITPDPAIIGWFNLMLLIPLLSGATALLMSMVTMRNTPTPEGAGGASTKMMMYMMPLMSLWFTMKVPAGVGLYWIISNVVAGVQALILNKFWNPKEMAEKMRAEDEARKEQERMEKIEAKKRAKEEGRNMDEKALSQKELNRQKLADARRRNAEKYGDYGDIEVTDEDLK
ncbi:MAG: membrane protein insertase YidC [Angelakisella sp.]|nr:membrane protein insertase YidC [Angelakisella sp.]